MKRVFFIAGEPSGDHRGGDLVAALARRLPDLEAYGVGGDDMQAAGMQLVHNITELSVIGLIEPIKHLPRLIGVRNSLIRTIAEHEPDAIVFIDYPGFNLHTAKRIKQRWPHIPVIYYVSPQLWAYWHWRIHTIRRYIDLMLVLLPFEVDVYEKGGRWALVDGDMNRIRIEERSFRRPSSLQVRYVGHPVSARIDAFVPNPQFRAELNLPADARVVALLPGSRDNEVNTMLPVMLDSAERLRTEFPDLRFVISSARPGLRPLIEACCESARISDFDLAYRIVPTQMYDIVHTADIALVTSGTAAFEAALMLKPILVLYRFNWISFIVARLLFRVPFINLANIVAMRRIVPEFIQHRMTARRIVPIAAQYLSDSGLYARTVADLRSVRDSLGHGDASEHAADEVCRFMRWTPADVSEP